MEWGIGVYPAHGLTNPNMAEWEAAFKAASGVARIAHLEVTYGEAPTKELLQLLDFKVLLARKIGMKVFIQVNTFGKVPPDLEAFGNDCLEIAGRYKPEYLCLGQEINYVLDENPDMYDTFVDVLKTMYALIRQGSPGTLAFPSFAYEPMRANHQEWLWSDFKSLPFFPFTSYPMEFMGMYPDYLFKCPRLIPNNYWDVSDITQKPVFVTETGWSTNQLWGGSRKGQAAYIKKVYELVRANPRIKMVEWITIADLVDENTTDTNGYPGTMGFFTVDGVDKGNWKLLRR